MTDSSSYIKCPICNSGSMIPVTVGSGEDRDVTYRCTNPECGVRFDKHGYERYDESTQEWARM